MKNFALVLLPLALASCAFTCDDRAGNVTVTTSVQTRFGVRVGGNIITSFFPTGGSLYRVGDQITFQINSRRAGYLRMILHNPDGTIVDPNLVNIPIFPGSNIVPQNVVLRAAPPTGTSCVVAIFTPSPRSGVVFSGNFSSNGFSSSLGLYFSPFAELDRDVIETCINVTF